jgi:O-methyltransferase
MLSLRSRIENRLNESIPPLDLPRPLRQTWRDVRRRHLTYTTPRQLVSLIRLCQNAEMAKEPGVIIEAGCARGGSAILLAATKSRHRPLLVYDVFGALPPPGEQDGEDLRSRYKIIASGLATEKGGSRHYSYEPDLYRQVKDAFAEFGHPIEERTVSLIQGPVQETLAVSESVCLAHIDVDWFEPVMACLERIVPNLSPHGALVVHAYLDWSGSRKAVDTYFERVGRDGFSFDASAGHLVVQHC